MKTLYTYLLIVLRWIPSLLALCALCGDIFQYFELEIWVINLFGGISIIPLIFIFIASYTFKFCVYHRIPLYYVVFNLSMSLITTLFDIPITNLLYVILSTIVFGVFMIWFIISKYRICKN